MILALAEIDAMKRETVAYNGRATCQYTGLISQIFGIQGKTDGEENYKAVFNSLKRLMGAVVDKMKVYGVSTRGKRKINEHTVSNLLVGLDFIEGSREISFVFNPFFYEALMNKHVTYIDIVFRARLNSLIAKSLYRFCQSHRKAEWCGNWTILIDALNINRYKQNGDNRKPSQIQRLIENAVDELIEKGYFDKKNTGFFKQKNNNSIKIKLAKSPHKKYLIK